jgi:hypothetical protein
MGGVCHIMRARDVAAAGECWRNEAVASGSTVRAEEANMRTMRVDNRIIFNDLYWVLEK